MTVTQSLQKRHLYRFDPIAAFLLGRLRFSPLIFGLFTILIWAGLYLLTAWITGTLWSKPGQTGLLQDWLPWLWVLVINPVVMEYYLWSFQAIDKVIQDLAASDVLEIDDAELEVINQIALDSYRPKWRKFLALASAVLLSTMVCLTRFGLSDSWTSSHPLVIALVTILAFIAIYLGSVLVLNLITNIWILHRILKRELQRKEFNVNPLHPDRCGGLRSLSDYALKTAYLVAILGMMVGFIVYQFTSRGVSQTYWFIYLLIPLHIILSIVCFVGPLMAAHRGMQRAKEELLREIARQFQADYTQIHASLTGNAETLKQGAEKIKELRAFYTLTDEFPVWPFDVKTFQRFLVTIPAPLLPALIGFLQKLIPLLLKQWGINLTLT